MPTVLSPPIFGLLPVSVDVVTEMDQLHPNPRRPVPGAITAVLRPGFCVDGGREPRQVFCDAIDGVVLEPADPGLIVHREHRVHQCFCKGSWSGRLRAQKAHKNVNEKSF